MIISSSSTNQKPWLQTATAFASILISATGYGISASPTGGDAGGGVFAWPRESGTTKMSPQMSTDFTVEVSETVKVSCPVREG